MTVGGRPPLFNIPWDRPESLDQDAENWRALIRMLQALEDRLGAGTTPLFVFGDGSDGDLTITAASTTASPLISYKEGSTSFGQGRDIWAHNLTFSNDDGTFDWDIQGYRIFATGTVLIDSGVVVHTNGRAGNGGTANKGVSARGGADPLIGSAVGQTAGAGSQGSAAGVGGEGITTTSLAVDIEKADGIGDEAVSGGAGGIASGGPGVGGGDPGGTVKNGPSQGTIRDLYHILGLASVSLLYRGGAGGAGGTSGSGTGGRGGGGGGVCAINGFTVRNNGTISSNGGAGAPCGSGNGGGGGGGGGGAIVFVFSGTLTPGTLEVLGGSGGAASGTGTDGEDGADGLVWFVSTGGTVTHL